MAINIKDFRMAIRIDNSEAKAKFDETKRQLEAVTAEMEKLNNEGKKNSNEYKALKKQQDALNTSLYRQRLEAGSSALTYNELRQGASRLRRALNDLKPGTAEWKQYREELRLTQQRMKELQGTSTQTGLSLGKLADGFNRYMGLAAGAVASITGMTLTMRQCVDEYAKMEEAESQVIKYTGMTREEVKQLNEQFKAMDTRTSREELNRLAGEAGKLGITGVDNVREFVEAADMINVALGEDLGEEAVNQIGKLSQMFGDESRSLKDNMLAIGSAVNQVAQSTSASEPYLVEFTARMGGVGKQANMSVTDIMGFASALDQNMLRSEMASTALSGLIMRIYQEPAKYAKLAQMDVEEFTKLVETDVNQAVLSFLSALNKMGGMSQIAPILKEMSLSGAEAASVISTLAGNVDMVRKEQENANKAFQEGTSIGNEYAVQNNTVQAGLDKARKEFQEVRVELGERLQPVMKNMISLGSLTVKGVLELIRIYNEYKGVILTTTATLAAFTVAMNAHAIVTKAAEVRTKALTVATRLLNAVAKVSPWGWVATVATAAITAFITLRQKTVDVTASIREMNKEVGGEQAKLDHLFTSLKSANEGTQLRRDLIKEINEQYGQYMPYLLDEKSTLDEIEGAYKRINSELTRQIAMKYKQQDVEEVTGNEGGTQVESIEEIRQSVLSGTGSRTFANAAIADLKEITASFYEEGMLWQKAYEQAYHSIKTKYFKGRSMSDFANEDMEAYIKSYYRMQQQLAEINEKYANWENPQPSNVIPEVVVTANKKRKNNQPSGGNGLLSDSEFQARQKQLEQQYREEQNLLKEKYLNEQLTQEEYQRQMYNAEIAHLARMIALQEKYGQDSSSTQGQIYDKMIAEADRRYQEEQKQQEDYLKWQEQAIKEANKQIEDYKKDEKINLLGQLNEADDLDAKLKINQEIYDKGLQSYEDYQRRMDEILEDHDDGRNERIKKALQTIGAAASSASKLIQALQDREISKVEARYDKQIEAARKAGKDTTELEEEKEAAISEIKKKYADKQFAMNILQIVSDTAVGIMKGYATLGPILGSVYAAITAAQGAAQVVVAKQQRDEAKGLYTGGYSEDYVQGYTSKGNPHDVAGVIPVHKNEFVANHEAVANPAVKQFLDVFDIAQKRGTIRMLNTTQILEQVRTRSGRYAGGYTDDGTGASRSSASPLAGMTAEQRSQVVVLLQENNRLLTILTQKELVVDPRKVRDGIKHIETLERNISR